MVFVHRLAHLSDIEYHFKCFIEAPIENYYDYYFYYLPSGFFVNLLGFAYDLYMASNVKSNFRPNPSSTRQDNTIWQSCQMRNPMQ